MKLQMKKKWKFGLKVADSHSEPGNLQKLEEIFIFLSFFFISNFFFFPFPCPWHLKSRKTMKINEKQWKTIKNKGKWKKMKMQMKKNENLDSKLQILTPNQEIFKNSKEFFIFLSFFFISNFIFFHFPCPWHLKSRKTMKINEKQWKTIKNKGKWKKHEVANEKKKKIWTQSCRFSLRTRKSSKTRGNFHFFIIFFSFQTSFFHFPCPWHLKSRKAMKINEKQWKTIKNKGKWKKMKLQMKKKMKIWIQSCRFSLRTRKSSKTRGNFHFFIIFFPFQTSFFFHCPCPLHLKSRKTMKINEKQWKTIKNKGKWKKHEVANEKRWKFGLKVADSHSEPGNLQKLEEIFIFLSCFFHFKFHFFSFSLPVAPEIQENHENQWKTMENHHKQRKMKKNEVANEKKNLDSKLQFSLRTRKSSKTRGNFHFFIIFFHFKLHFFFIVLENPGKPWKSMKSNGKPSKTKEHEKKNEVANEKNEVWWQMFFSFQTSFFSFSLVMNENKKKKQWR